MFLLILIISRLSSVLYDTLHSTMFLLIQCGRNIRIVCGRHFTFHDVSINTRKVMILKSRSRTSLHSTMFLLIPDEWIPVIMAVIFTFHDVSINTKNTRRSNPPLFMALHSTMFLLIHDGAVCLR